MAASDQPRSSSGRAGAAWAALFLILAFPLAGCGEDGPSSIASRSFAGLPDGVDGTDADLEGFFDVLAFLLPEGDLALTAWGSGSCPAIPVALEVESAHAVQITLESPKAEACSADVSPTTNVIPLPPGRVDTTSDVQLTLFFSGYLGATPRRLTARPLTAT